MRYTFTLIIIILFFSCSSKKKSEIEIDSTLIKGEWTTGRYPYQDLRFENGKFYDSNEIDNKYSFKINSDSLIITNKEEERKLFKILKLTKDSLILIPIPQETFMVQNNKRFTDNEERVYHKMTEQEIYNKYLNSIKGHIEKDTIIGIFTGLGIDTLYVCEEEDKPLKGEKAEPYSLEYFLKYHHYYARSNNPNIPDVEIYGHPWGAPRLVFEGDLDGDGKDEWGYTNVWDNSQWRQYRVYNYDPNKKKWRHLYYDTPDSDKPQILHTPHYIRASGIDLVEKGPEPGLIKIHYGEYDRIVYDTLVRPNYIPINSQHF